MPPASSRPSEAAHEVTQFEWRRLVKQFPRLRYPIAAVAPTTAEVCRPFLQMAVTQGSCLLAYAKSIDPQRGRLTLIAEEFGFGFRGPTDRSKLLDVVDVETSLTGLAVETKQAQYFPDLHEVIGRRCFRDKNLLELLPKAASLLVVPVRNISNPHQVMLVISLYLPNRISLPFDKWRQGLDQPTRALAEAVESSLRERAFRASIGVSQRLGHLDMLSEKAYEIFALSVREALDADQVTIYVEKKWAPAQLSRRANSWKDASLLIPSGSLDVPIPEKVLEVRTRNREFLADVKESERERSCYFEEDLTNLKGHVLLAPLHSTGGRCSGVIRCLRVPRGPQDELCPLFSYDDLAIVEAMEQAFAPPLETLLASEQRDVSLQKLAHELRVPTTAFRAVLERMERECRQQDFRFRFPHFREAWIYADLMNRLVKEMDIVRKGTDDIPLVFQDTNIYTDVVIPAKRFLEPILRKHGFAPFQLTDGGFPNNQGLRIDAPLITQVLFNLVENAIKYFPKDRPRGDFVCVIEGQVSQGNFEIAVMDNGAGILEEDRERIFDFSYRGALALAADVQGSGLGLWISRALARRHKGDLVLRKLASPTTFVLSIPIQLRAPAFSFRYIS